MKNLILWSDLHVSVPTLDTALAAMRLVRELAERNDAIPVFLGDFWNVANVVDTNCLNAVIAELEHWRGLGSWWLVGNHDQVDLAGQTHGLDLVRAMCPDAIVATEPTRIDRFMLVPYRRDKQKVLDAIKDCTSENTAAILCHVDILGAQFNDKIQSFHGIAINALPRLPIFTGHYHKPHAVNGAEHIVYVGSPYQTGFGEAQQEKRVILFDALDPGTYESLPITIGPRHVVIDQSTGDAPELRAGDRVVFKVSEPGGTPEQREWLAQMAADGIIVEVRVEGGQQKRARIENARELDVGSLWTTYGETAHLRADVIAEGSTILAIPNLWTEKPRPQMDVKFIAVDVKGYGPFLDAHTYPLDRRGAVMIAGRNLDDPGSQSNGAGKSTVVFAAHWALTGRTDARPTGNVMKGLADEMVNDEAKDAEVVLVCEVNGKTLIITRSMGKGGHKLGVNYDGKDCSGQTVALSQSKLDAIVDTDLLTRTVFFGQHAARGFLEATDAAAKEQLGEVVSMAPWEAALARVKGRMSVADGNIASVRTEMGAIEGRIAEIDVIAMEARSTAWEQERVVRIAGVDEQLSERGVDSHNWTTARDGRHAAQLAVVTGIETESQTWATAQKAEVDRLHGAYDEAVRQSTEWETARTGRIAEVQKLIDAARGEAASVVSADVLARRDDLRKRVDQLRAPLPASEDQRVALRNLTTAQAARGEADKAVSDSIATGKSRREEHDRRLAAHVIERQRLVENQQKCPTCSQTVGADVHAQLLVDQDARHATEKATLTASLKEATDQYRARKAAADAAAAAVVTAENAVTHANEAQGLVETQRRADLAQLEPQLSVVQSDIDNAQAVARAKVSGYETQIAGIRAERCPVSFINASSMLAMQKNITNPHTARITAARAAADAILREANPYDYAIRQLTSQKDAIQRETNPHEAAKASASARIESLIAERERFAADIAAKELDLDVLVRLEAAFSRTGVQNYVMEEALVDLQSRVHRYLDGLSGGYLSLELRACSISDKGKVSEKFSKKVQVRRRDGRYVERAVQQLSGGQWRRESTAMTLAYAEFVAARTGIRSNMLVLDEVFQHLDPQGRARVASMVRDLDYETILVITHDLDLATVFETVDLVVMHNDVSVIRMGVDPNVEIIVPPPSPRAPGPVKGAKRLGRTVGPVAGAPGSVAG